MCVDDDSSSSSSSTGGGDRPPVVQILLPEIHADAAKALLCYLYTDVIPYNCLGMYIHINVCMYLYMNECIY
jgi:hypothetical protein